MVEVIPSRVCDRCDVPMSLKPLYDGSTMLAWYCSCCKSKLRTPEMMQAESAVRRAELGMTEEQWDAHCRSFIRTDPLTPAELARIRILAKQHEAEWKPACEHDTDNPWRSDG